MTPLWHPSPNFGARRGVAQPDMIVLHYTAMETAEAALERLCDPEHEVSAHYLIAEDGRIWQMVRDEDRAWHAGRGRWGAISDVNSHSIGIELDNRGERPFPEPQMDVLVALLADLRRRWDIPPEGVIGHQDMAPDRKQDPGRHFDWRHLALRGHASWPDFDPLQEAEDAVFAGNPEMWIVPLRAAGYTADVPAEALLDAFRARFRPWATGPCRIADVQTAQHLANDYPVDAVAPMA